MDKTAARRLDAWIRAKYVEKRYAPDGVEEPCKAQRDQETLFQGSATGQKEGDGSGAAVAAPGSQVAFWPTPLPVQKPGSDAWSATHTLSKELSKLWPDAPAAADGAITAPAPRDGPSRGEMARSRRSLSSSSSRNWPRSEAEWSEARWPSESSSQPVPPQPTKGSGRRSASVGTLRSERSEKKPEAPRIPGEEGGGPRFEAGSFISRESSASSAVVDGRRSLMAGDGKAQRTSCLPIPLVSQFQCLNMDISGKIRRAKQRIRSSSRTQRYSQLGGDSGKSEIAAAAAAAAGERE